VRWKVRLVETIPVMGVWEIRDNDGVSEFNYDKL
jgi:hypothetical protein